MNTFYEVLGFVMAICTGVIVLTLFFTALGYLKRLTRGPGVLAVSGFVRSDKLVQIHMSDGRVTPKIRFIGCSEASSKSSPIPYPLSSMVVFETEAGARLMIRPDSIKMIEEVAEVA